MNKEKVINLLFAEFSEVRYAAIYLNEDLFFKQKNQLNDISESETDKYEELLVNPTILKAVSQRGNIDCGGLEFLLVRYGNFYQLLKPLPDGHLSICLDKTADITKIPKRIFDFLEVNQAKLRL